MGISAYSAGFLREWKQVLRDSRGVIEEVRGNIDVFCCNAGVAVPVDKEENVSNFFRIPFPNNSGIISDAYS